MRPQQNRRISNGRRNNNNGAVRRAPNPLSRNYESSGPDVKIRGNAQHIADKYLALARDAQASGDRVTGENYLQHAEHYTRIILSAQAHENHVRLSRHEGEPKAEEASSAAADSAADEESGAPQPVIEGMPGEVTLIGRNGGYSAEPRAEGAEEGEEGRLRPRRRLPARRGAERGERTPSAARVRAADYSGGEQPAAAEDTGRKPARARRPRRVKPGETEHTDNI